MSKCQEVLVSQDELIKQNEYSCLVRELLDREHDKTGRNKKAFVHSYGCQQNISDGEKLQGMLVSMGYELTEELKDADFVLYNTCAIRESAQDRVFGNVGELKCLKTMKPEIIIGLCGCMVQQEHVTQKVLKSYPFVNLIFGTFVSYKLPELVFNKLKSNEKIVDITENKTDIIEGVPLKREGKYKAWLPIMYGCDNFCSYCVVPYVRGRERSRTSSAIIEEAKTLINEGFKEITLLGQNVNSYGKGLEEKVTFSGLLNKLCELEGDFRIRFMTSHPKDATKELIDTMATQEKVCKHLHLPIQSGNDRILKLMNRGYNRANYLELIKYARAKMPDITISSDIIVGFPGEIYEEFLDTLSLINEVKFNYIYTFIYSKRKGTKAENFEDNISYDEKSKWLRQALAAQRENGIFNNSSRVGAVLKVFVDGKGKAGDGYMAGKTEGNVAIEFLGDENDVGKFVNLRVTKALNLALLGEKI